jgi:hypothetical protein
MLRVLLQRWFRIEFAQVQEERLRGRIEQRDRRLRLRLKS